MKCQACNRHLGSDWSNHHYHWPRKYVTQEQRRIQIKLHKRCHDDYHAYFFRYCLYERACLKKSCRFANICCFYGHRVV